MGERVKKKIVVLNFIGIIQVMLLHSTGSKYFEVTDTLNAIILRVVQKYNFSGVMMFFLISGFLFFANIDITKVTIQTFTEKWKKRIKSIVIPYFAWSILWMLIVAIMSQIPFLTSKMESFQTFEMTFDSVMQGIFLSKYCGALWYLRYLCVFFLLSPVFFQIIKNKKRGYLWIIVLFLVSFLKIQYLFESNNCGFLFYNIGAFLGIHGKRIIEIRNDKRNCVVAFGILVLIFAFGPILCQNHYIRVITSFIKIVSIWVILDLIEEYKIYGFMKITFFIYAFHGVAQQCVNKVCQLVMPNTGSLSGICAILNTIIGVAGTYCLGTMIAWLLKKYFPKLFCIFSGGRG